MAARCLVSFRMPEDPLVKDRLKRSAAWLVEHIVAINAKDDGRPLRVIAWKDPTLEPKDPKLLAGYVITDTLWAAKALKLFDLQASNELEASIQSLGCTATVCTTCFSIRSTGFATGPTIRTSCTAIRWVRFQPPAGQSSISGSFANDGMPPSTLAILCSSPSIAVYAALYDFWHGRTAPARRRILDIIADSRKLIPKIESSGTMGPAFWSTMSTTPTGSPFTQASASLPSFHVQLGGFCTRFAPWILSGKSCVSPANNEAADSGVPRPKAAVSPISSTFEQTARAPPAASRRVNPRRSPFSRKWCSLQSAEPFLPGD